jgi:hypothetical protein
MPEVPGPLGGVINVGGYVGDRQVTQRGPVTYISNVAISGDGRYLGNTPVTQTRDGRIYVGNDVVSRWAGSNYVGPDKVSRR